MNRKFWSIFLPLATINSIVLALIYLKGFDFQLLFPAGLIAQRQAEILVEATLLMLVIVIPVVTALFAVAFFFRESNTKIKRDQQKSSSMKIQLLWWAAPSLIIMIIAFLTWNNTHALDPKVSIASQNETLKIQVVSLMWKWLFLYPEQNIATVNYLKIPVDTPVEFEMTSDAPMNSLWIPSLAGQMYTMTGMSTRLNILSKKTGEFPGQSAEISGKGFSGMRFNVSVVSRTAFDSWVSSLKGEKNDLSENAYNLLSKPSENVPPILYSSYDKELYKKIIGKYMSH